MCINGLYRRENIGKRPQHMLGLITDLFHVHVNSERAWLPKKWL